VVVRGSVYEDGNGVGLYMIALHGHSSDGKLAHLAIALKDRNSQEDEPCASAMDVISSSAEIGFMLVDWKISPWRKQAYLGRMLSPEEVRKSSERDTFFHAASHVVTDVDEVVVYFSV
jgi:hypothetical protein